ncbi:MAG: hypothetical protein FJ045_00490 [Crenarchaeota archaeon]|nr:hypothetical protein [Thermoproteota archaeon]
MLKNNFGKLLVYASTGAPNKKRLQSVRTATEKTAKLLNLEFEMVRFRKSFSQIYVYYESGDDEPVPLYCDKGKAGDLQDICATLRKMVFVLSFHPKHSALKQVRSAIMRLS